MTIIPSFVKGLAKQSSMPISIYLITSTGSKLEVIEMMGVFRSNFLIRLVAMRPSILGIRISIRTISNGSLTAAWCFILDTAFNPSQANSILQPINSRMVEEIFRHTWSSSTINTLGDDGHRPVLITGLGIGIEAGLGFATDRYWLGFVLKEEVGLWSSLVASWWVVCVELLVRSFWSSESWTDGVISSSGGKGWYWWWAWVKRSIWRCWKSSRS